MKIGRNETCLCGTGKKYKNCCGRPSVQEMNGVQAQIGTVLFKRAIEWIDERLSHESIPFPERPARAVRMMIEGGQRETGYRLGDLDPHVGTDLTIQIARWYQDKYPPDFLTPGLRIATEEQFQQLMERVDEEEREEGTLIQARPIRALIKLSKLTKNELRLTVPNREPEPGSYSGDDLVIRMERWYEQRYGSRLNVADRLGTVAFLIRGDVWLFRIPVIGGGGPGVLWICEYGGLTTLPTKPPIVRRGQRAPQTQYNILKSVDNLPDGLARSLTAEEREQMRDVFVLGFDALDALDRCRPTPLVDAARGDIEATVGHLSRHPMHPGQAKWAALQAAEKMLKAVLSSRSEAYGRTHDLSKLALSMSELGIPPVDPLWLASLQTPSDARYGEIPVSVEDAVGAHHASLRIVLHTAEHLPKR